jgi:signal transduction histidine kinase
MRTWEKEASELQLFYTNLEKLVEQRAKELKEAHEREIKHEKEIQELKDQFVFIAAHGLKAPVTAIKWGLQLALEQEKKKLDPELVEYLKDVQNSNNRLITLVNDLLNVARIEAGTIKIDKKSMDLKKLIRSTLKERGSVFKEKVVTVDYLNGEKLMINADPDRLKQVMINLLSNATKYNREKGKIIVKVEKNGKSVKVSVSDTGIRIKEKDMKTLFEKFGRVKSEDTKHIEGTGLGLYLCKEIITQSGGKIDAESEYGKGSTFWFTLPISS